MAKVIGQSTKDMVREMVGGCCVCLDDRGWDENPLVYCDGHGCNVAVHQACYGIVKVPSGPWFCCKCQSTERIARVGGIRGEGTYLWKCELCPLKEGALKRTDTQGWAHVVCALYIPEVRFGNVSTMEPIILASVPHERYLKTCYICEENGRESKTSSGACMACNKPGCKLSFHVTCAQAKRLLCEESGHGNGNVQYVGYCANHWAKKPVSKSGNDSDSKRINKKSRIRTDSVSSTEGTLQKQRGRKPNTVKAKSGTPPVSSDGSTTASNGLTSSGGKIDNQPNYNLSAISNASSSTPTSTKSNAVHSRAPYPVSQVQFSVTDLLSEDARGAGRNTSSASEEVTQSKREESCTKDKGEQGKGVDKSTTHTQKKRKLMEKVSEKIVKKQKLLKKDKEKKLLKTKKKLLEANKPIKNGQKTKRCESKITPRPKRPEVYENGELRPLQEGINRMTCPSSFQELLECQWNQGAQFILQKANHFDVASLLSTLHQLRSDNLKLESRLQELTSRRDRLLAANARLSMPLTVDHSPNNPRPLSSMLSKLRDDVVEDGKHSNGLRTPLINGEGSCDSATLNGLMPKIAASGLSPTSDGSAKRRESPVGSKKSETKTSNISTSDKKDKRQMGSNGQSKEGKNNKSPVASGKKEKKKGRQEKADQERNQQLLQQQQQLQQHFLMSQCGQPAPPFSGSLMQPMYSCTQEPSGLLQPGPSLLSGPSSFIHQMLQSQQQQQQQQHRQSSSSLHCSETSPVGMLGLMQSTRGYGFSTPSHENAVPSGYCYGSPESSKVNSHKK